MRNSRVGVNPGLAFLLCGFILSLCCAGLDASQESSFFNSDIDISMDFQDASIRDILKLLSIQSGMNFIASEGVQDRRVTLYLNKVPLKEAMDKIFKANNLSYDLDRSSSIFIVKDWGKPAVETITKIFFLKYATVSVSALEGQKAVSSESGMSAAAAGSSSGITEAIKKVISANGSVVEDGRTNSLIITDIPTHMPIIAATIAGLDVPMAQVMLEVEMLDVSKGAVDKIGFKWGSATGSSLLTMVLTGGTATSGWPFTKFMPLPEVFRSHDIEKTRTAGSIDFSTSTYTMLLDFFRSQVDTKILARPKILTLNNQTAELKITTNETIGIKTSTTTGASTTDAVEPERVETGVLLKVTPQINEKTGEITMFIMPTVKDTSTSTFVNTQADNQAFKDPEERSTKATVRIRDGETVVIGGLIRKERSETITKLPFFGDIPFLRRAFTHRNKERDRERELLVFITPHIIRDKTNAELIQMKNPGIPEREQGITSKIDREATISTSLNEFEERKR